MNGNGNVDAAEHIIYRIPARSTRDETTFSPEQRWLLVALAALVILTAGIIRFHILEQRAPPGPRAFIGRDVIGYTITNDDGARLGQVADILLDAEAGTARYLILEVDRELPAGKANMAGIKGWLVPVPWTLVALNEDEQILWLEVSPDTLTQAPKFGTLPDTTDANWDARVRRYWTEQ